MSSPAPQVVRLAAVPEETPVETASHQGGQETPAQAEAKRDWSWIPIGVLVVLLISLAGGFGYILAKNPAVAAAPAPAPIANATTIPTPDANVGIGAPKLACVGSYGENPFNIPYGETEKVGNAWIECDSNGFITTHATDPQVAASGTGSTVSGQEPDGYIMVKNTPYDGNVRMAVNRPGQPVSAVIFYEYGGTHKYLRIVCDDHCLAFTYFDPNGRPHPIEPDYTYIPNFDYKSLSGAERQLVVDSGINVEESEVLAQHIFVGTQVQVGGRIVVSGEDDPGLAVNRQVFVAGSFQ